MHDSLPKKTIAAAETRPHLASLRSTENLAQNLLGFFDLKDTVTVLPGAHSDNGALLYTSHHEHSHQRIIKVTSFGKFQSILALLAENSRLLPAHLHDVNEMLHETMGVSWYAHEGYATYNEFSLASLSSRTSLNIGRMSPLPDDYAEALSLYRSLVDALPENLIPFAKHFADAVAQVVFNTPILRAFPFERLASAELRRHLAVSNNKPDERLLRLEELVRLSPLRERSWQSMRDNIDHLLLETGLPPDYDAQDYVDSLRTDPSLKIMADRRRVRRILVDLFAAEIFRLLPELGETLPSQVHQIADRYVDEIAIAAHSYGIVLPRLTMIEDVDPVDARLIQLGVELQPSKILDEYTVRPDETSRIVEGLLSNEQESSVCIDIRSQAVGANDSGDSPSQYKFRVTLVRWKETKVSGSDKGSGSGSPIAPLWPQPSSPQIVFNDSPEKLAPVFQAISGQVVWVVLELEDLSNQLGDEIASIFGEWKGRFFCFYPTTNAYFVVQLLRHWRANGGHPDFVLRKNRVRSSLLYCTRTRPERYLNNADRLALPAGVRAQGALGMVC